VVGHWLKVHLPLITIVPTTLINTAVILRLAKKATERESSQERISLVRDIEHKQSIDQKKTQDLL
jgi:hypothetical protein